MRMKKLIMAVVVIVLLAALLAACGGGGGTTAATQTYTVGGTVSGLVGTGLVLQNNGGDNLTINADGSFTFPTVVTDGSSYAVTVLTSPTNPGQGCIVTNDAGTLAGANVTSIRVSCPRIVTTIATGSLHICAKMYDDSVKCWGDNQFGQLGLGDTANRGDGANEMGTALPIVELGAARTAVEVAAGAYHSCALLDNGSVKCWGYNGYGQLGLGDTANRGDGLNEMGDNLAAVALGTGRTALQLVAGSYHSCALLDNGSVKCWGYNGYGQLGLGDTANRGDGLNEMGDNLAAVDLETGRTALQISAGAFHTCALLDNGNVKCWGANWAGYLGLGDTGDRGDEPNEMGDNLSSVDLGTGRHIVRVISGDNARHTCAQLDDSTVKCWGANGQGGLGLGDTASRGDGANEMGDNLLAVDLGTGHTAKSPALGYAYSCSILNDGNMKCWGGNSFGQLGLGDTMNRGDGQNEMGNNLAVVDLGAGRTATELAAGDDFACARLDNGAIKCWGCNGRGQLGQGDTHCRGDEPNEMGDNLPPVYLSPNLVISEIMKNPNVLADAVGEWVEIYNAGFTLFDLNGCTLSDNGANMHTINASVVVLPGGYVTLAASAAPGFTPNYVYTLSEFQLGNNDDEVILTCSGTVIDRVDYDLVAFPNPVGASLSLNPLKMNALDNDIGANWCAATTFYNGDLGTPGAMNDACP